jgi:dynein light chain LC8-type
MSITPEVKIIDLSDQLKNEIINIIKWAFSEPRSEKAIAEYIRAKLEEKDEGKWNVILGKDFGSHIVHRSRKYGYFQVGEINILLWQSG